MENQIYSEEANLWGILSIWNTINRWDEVNNWPSNIRDFFAKRVLDIISWNFLKEKWNPNFIFLDEKDKYLSEYKEYLLNKVEKYPIMKDFIFFKNKENIQNFISDIQNLFEKWHISTQELEEFLITILIERVKNIVNKYVFFEEIPTIYDRQLFLWCYKKFFIWLDDNSIKVFLDWVSVEDYYKEIEWLNILWEYMSFILDDKK